MRVIFPSLSLIILIIASSACQDTSPYIAEIKAVGTGHLITLDASKRTILVNQSGRFCAEPAPDAMGAIFTHLAANLSGKGKGKGAIEAELTGNIDTTTSTSVFELFQRSQGVQLLRDGLYRLCEAHLNGAIGSDEYRENLVNLITTLNYVVPVELCSRIIEQRLVQDFEEIPKAEGQTPEKPTRKLLKVKTERGVPQEVIKSCLSTTLEFTQAAQAYSRTVMEQRSIEKISLSAPPPPPSPVTPPLAPTP